MMMRQEGCVDGKGRGRDGEKTVYFEKTERKASSRYLEKERKGERDERGERGGKKKGGFLGWGGGAGGRVFFLWGVWFWWGGAAKK